MSDHDADAEPIRLPRHSTGKSTKSATSSYHTRDLVNRSRNGFYGAQYIEDVKQYFDHDTNDGLDEKQKKKYLTELLADFRELLEITKDTNKDSIHDTLFVENVEEDPQALAAHRQLLSARSATFEALFNSEDFLKGDEYLGFKLLSQPDESVRKILLPRGNDDQVEINLKIMEAILHYMYWGNVDKDMAGNLENFYEVASFLDLKELRRQLAEDLYGELKKLKEGSDEASNRAIEYLKLAVKCECKFLKRKTMAYIVKNRQAILKSGEWKKLAEESKDLAREVYDLIVEETKKK